jgi:hypothetical protein
MKNDFKLMKLEEEFRQLEGLERVIRENLRGLGYGV